MLIIDGNIKNHRDVCFASHAGYTEYSGLPGKVCTGCPNTPDYSSRYCKTHKPTVAIPQVSEQGTDDRPQKSLVQEDQVGLIISKRVTRKSVLYQVSVTVSLVLVRLRFT